MHFPSKRWEGIRVGALGDSGFHVVGVDGNLEEAGTQKAAASSGFRNVSHMVQRKK